MGIFAALFGALGATGKDLVSKSVSLKVDATLSTFASFLFALPFYFLAFFVGWLLGFETLTWSGNFWMYVFLRAFTDVFAEGFKMRALLHGDVSVVSSFISFTPIFTALIAPLLTGDRVTWLELTGILIVVGGSLVLIRRNNAAVGHSSQTKGILFALLAAMCFAINSCFDQLAVHSGTPLFSGFSMTALAGLLVVPALRRVREVRGQLVACRNPFLLRGFFEMTHMSGKLIALQFLSAPVVTGIQRAALLFSIVFGRVLFHEKETARRLIAGTIIFFGVLIISFAQVVK